MPQFLIDKTGLDEEMGVARLEGAEARHLLKALRARAGDEVLLFDGKGGRWRSVLKEARPDSALLGELETLPDREPPFKLHLACGLIKGQRWQWLVEKATELGATRITPLLTERTIARPDRKRGAQQRDKWQTAALSAAKQCERGRVPEVDEPINFTAFLNQLGEQAEDEERLACLERTNDTPEEAKAQQPISIVVVAIGPEGGWSEEEVAQLEGAGFSPQSLGPRILRGETAAVASLALLLNR